MLPITTFTDFAGVAQSIRDLSIAFTGSTLPPPGPPPKPPPTVTSIVFTATGGTTSARITPAIAGITVSYSDVGTDGYTTSGTRVTDAGGNISFFIPAGQKGVVDTFIVTVVGGPSATTTHKW